MGTDYDEFRKPCPCGQGTIRIECSSPDHRWVSAYNVHWVAGIECPPCQQTYTIDGTDQAMRIVRRADVAAVAAQRSAYDAARRQFMASATVLAIERDFAACLDGMASVAAVHRYLEANGIAGCAIGAFRKTWKGGQDWTSQHVGEWNIAKIVDLLGGRAASFAAELAQIDRLKAAIGSVPTVMGRIVEGQIPK